MNLVSSVIDDFLFILFQQKNEINKGKYTNGIQMYIFLGNFIRKCVSSEFDVAVFVVRRISVGKGLFWVENTRRFPVQKRLQRLTLNF